MAKGVIFSEGEARRTQAAVEAFERRTVRTVTHLARPRRVFDYVTPSDRDAGGYPTGTGGCDETDRLPIPLSVKIGSRYYAHIYKATFPADTAYAAITGEHELIYAGDGTTLIWESDEFTVSCIADDGYGTSDTKKWRLTATVVTRSTAGTTDTFEEARLELVDVDGTAACDLSFTALRFGADWWDALAPQGFRILHSAVDCYQFDEARVCVKPVDPRDIDKALITEGEGSCAGAGVTIPYWWWLDLDGFVNVDDGTSYHDTGRLAERRYWPIGPTADNCYKAHEWTTPDGDYVQGNGITGWSSTATYENTSSGTSGAIIRRVYCDATFSAGSSAGLVDVDVIIEMTSDAGEYIQWLYTAADVADDALATITLNYDSVVATLSPDETAAERTKLADAAPATIKLQQATPTLSDDLDGDGRPDYHPCSSEADGYGGSVGGGDAISLVYVESGKTLGAEGQGCNAVATSGWVVAGCQNAISTYNGTPPGSPSHGDVWPTTTSEECLAANYAIWLSNGTSWVFVGGNSPYSGDPFAIDFLPASNATDCVYILYY